MLKSSVYFKLSERKNFGLIFEQIDIFLIINLLLFHHYLITYIYDMHAYFLHRKVMIILANNLDSHVKIQQAFSHNLCAKSLRTVYGFSSQFCSRAEKKSISKKNKYLENFFRN